MNWLFDMDKPLMRGLSVIADLILLNLLTLLCALPVITAGASFCAAFSVALRNVRNEDGIIVKDFFGAFRGNFRKATILWLMSLLAVVLLAADWIAAKLFVPVLIPAIGAMAVMLLVLGLYAFALLARYENTIWATLTNAAALAVGYFPRTLGMVAFCLAFWALCVRFLVQAMPILFLFGFSLPCYVCGLLMNDIFYKLENNK